MIEVTLHGAEIQSREALHDALARELHLPEWYGRNLDALYDCLGDLQEEVTLRIEHAEALEQSLGRYARALRHMLQDADHAFQRFTFIED